MENEKKIEHDKLFDDEKISMGVFNYLIDISTFNTEDNVSFFRAYTSLSAICKVIFPKQDFSKLEFRKLAETKVIELLNRFITDRTPEGKSFRIKLADRAVVVEMSDGKNLLDAFFDIQFSLTVSAVILISRLLDIQNSDGQHVTVSDFTKQYEPLWGERFKDIYLLNKLEHTYTIERMVELYPVSDMNEGEIMSKFQKMLSELQTRHFLVEEYQVVNGGFHLKWVPLSEEEQKNFVLIKEGV